MSLDSLSGVARGAAGAAAPPQSWYVMTPENPNICHFYVIFWQFT